MKKFLLSVAIVTLYFSQALSGVVLEGGIKSNAVDSNKIDYDVKFGIKWNINTNQLYTRIWANNNEGYNTISLLAKYDWQTLFPGQIVYPFAVFTFDNYSNLDGEHNIAWRILSGIGAAIKVDIFNWLYFSAQSGANLTMEVYTGFNSPLVLWWRSRARFGLKILDWLTIKTDAVVSLPLWHTYKWQDYNGILSFKISDKIRLNAKLHLYNHKVTKQVEYNKNYSLQIEAKL